ncbi:RNA polymerase sigma factor [candidate division KSB1 bacterium]|nr:RNA polymerase sigma factor [candidate division KSB1 bacterium]
MTAGERQERIDQALAEEARLFAFIRRRIPDLEEARDVMQDVFYRVIAGIDQLESLEKITAWVYSIARNRIVDWRRKKRPIAVSRLAQEESLSLVDLLPDLSNQPERDLLSRLIWETVEETLAALPAEQREVFVQHEFEGKSFAELAREMDCSINTLISRKRYAVLALRRNLETLYGEHKEN